MSGQHLGRSNARSRMAWGVAICALFLLLLIVGKVYFSSDLQSIIDQTLVFARGAHVELPAAIIVFVATAYVGAPQIVLIAACVIAFGPEQGFWYSWIATIASGAVTYLTGRLPNFTGSKRVQNALGERFTRQIAKNVFLASLFVRFVPLAPFAIVNVAFGAARAEFSSFLGGLALGVLPKTAFVAFAGDGVMDAFEGEHLSALVMAAGALGLLFLWTALSRRSIRRITDE